MCVGGLQKRPDSLIAPRCTGSEHCVVLRHLVGLHKFWMTDHPKNPSSTSTPRSTRRDALEAAQHDDDIITVTIRVRRATTGDNTCIDISATEGVCKVLRKPSVTPLECALGIGGCGDDRPSWSTAQNSSHDFAPPRRKPTPQVTCINAKTQGMRSAEPAESDGSRRAAMMLAMTSAAR